MSTLHTPRQIPRDPSLPPVPELLGWTVEYCECPKPMPREHAVRRGAARTHCARCERELPLRLHRVPGPGDVYRGDLARRDYGPGTR
jgi:hypothetical protein